MRYLVFIFLVINSLLAQESKTVKTSELELFLFKVGFDSLLKDVERTKDKSVLNEVELRKLNDKVELIMNEIYKDKRVLKTDNSQTIIKSDNSEDIKLLKEEIQKLKNEVNDLKKQKVEVSKSLIEKTNNAIVIVDEGFIRSKASLNSKIIEKVKKNQNLNIDSCDKFDWCKLKDKKGFVAKYIIQL